MTSLEIILIIGLIILIGGFITLAVVYLNMYERQHDKIVDEFCRDVEKLEQRVYDLDQALTAHKDDTVVYRKQTRVDITGIQIITRHLEGEIKILQKKDKIE